METHIPNKRELELIALDENLPQLEAVTKALGSSTRLEVLKFLGAHTCSVLEIAEALGLPQSTATLHIGILEKAGLIKTDLQPATRGVQKVCARVYDRIIVQLPTEHEAQELVVRVSMPLGAFVEAIVYPTCGLLSENKIIGQLDQPAAFFEPERIHAQLLWFRRGYVEYRFPNRSIHHALLENLEVSFEACSEAPLHHDDWPSDISVWINGIDIGSWTSPASFGGERGALTPAWWDTNNSQYGLLKIWKVTPQGSFVDGAKISNVTLDNLKIAARETISLRIGVKDDARHVGGVNLFGSRFGNYPQDIILKLTYKQQP